MLRHVLASVLLAALLPAAAAVAQAPPPRLALEIHVDRTWRNQTNATSLSVARRLSAHLVPLLEAQGWQVVRVQDAARAAKGKQDTYHAAVRIDVEARPIYLVDDARVYADEHGRTVVANPMQSFEAWGDFRVEDGLTHRALMYGDLPHISPQVRAVGGGGPALDDEEAVARLFADACLEAVTPGLDLTLARRP